MSQKLTVGIILVAIVFIAYKINWYIKNISPIINNLSQTKMLAESNIQESITQKPIIQKPIIQKPIVQNSIVNHKPIHNSCQNEPYELYMGAHEYMKDHPNRNFLVTPPGMNHQERLSDRNYHQEVSIERNYPKNKQGLIDTSKIMSPEPVGVLGDLASVYDDTMENGAFKEDNILFHHNITSESCVNKQIKQTGCSDINSCKLPAPLSTRRVSY